MIAHMIPEHAAQIQPARYLLLYPAEGGYEWQTHGEREPTGCVGATITEAIQLGYKQWADDYFRLLHCGFLYTLPVRDEVGNNALFSEMAQSYAMSNGQFFDKRRGHLCFVDFASKEALDLWKELR